MDEQIIQENNMTQYRCVVKKAMWKSLNSELHKKKLAYLVNLSKRGGKDRVIQGLAWLLRGIS